MNQPKILLSVFACSPKWGSEVGTGWSWVFALSKYYNLHVITEEGFKADIEDNLKLFDDRNTPIFHFVDIGEKGRKLFWDQGNWGFYYYYKKWQKKAYQVAVDLHRENCFDIIHQLGMIGFREPGYLWKLSGKHVFIWGPIGGMGYLPLSFLPSLGVKACVVYFLKNILNAIQIYSNIRVRKAFKRADLLFSATVDNQNAIRSVFKRQSILLNETGANEPIANEYKCKDAMTIAWCGIMQNLKSLNVLLDAIKILSKNSYSIKLHIIGDGKARSKWEKQCNELGISDLCIWHGRVPNKSALEIIRHSDVMVISSIREGTPHVLLEALENGIPVICHDACGMSSIVDDQSGILIPMISPRISSILFAKSLSFLYHNKDVIRILSEGAMKRAIDISWDKKAQLMKSFYEESLSHH